MQSDADLMQIVQAGDPSGGLAADCTAGNKIAIKTPMIVMTTSNSTSEKPRRASLSALLPHGIQRSQLDGVRRHG